LIRHNMTGALADRIRAYPAEGTSYWRASLFVLLAIRIRRLQKVRGMWHGWKNRDAYTVLAGKPEGSRFISWRNEELEIILKSIF